MELSQKLYKYCPKEWKKEASKVRQYEVTWVRLHLSAKLFLFLKKVYFSCYTLGKHLNTLYSKDLERDMNYKF